MALSKDSREFLESLNFRDTSILTGLEELIFVVAASANSRHRWSAQESALASRRNRANETA